MIRVLIADDHGVMRKGLRLQLEQHEGIDGLAQALESAGFNVDLVNDARALVWSKLVISSAINPLTALLRVPNGQLLQRPAARALVRALAEETVAVASAERIELAPGDPVRAVEDVALRTGTNHSSMFYRLRLLP